MTAASEAISARTGWIAGALVPLLALAIFINYVDRGNLATAAPLIKGELKISNTQFGLLVSAFFWIYAPGQLLAAWAAQRFNPYRTLTFGLALWSIATMLSGSLADSSFCCPCASCSAWAKASAFRPAPS